MSKLFKHTGSLRVRFALGFGILVTIFLAVVLIITYISFSKFRNEGFHDRTSELNFLKWSEIAIYVLGVIIAWASSYLFVKKLMQPLEKLHNNLSNVNYNNLDLRLTEKGQGEEVDSLSITFNQMLARLQQSISFQKDFIHYASHELRTPLAAMVSLTEKSLDKSLSEKEAQQVLEELYKQQKTLTNITNSLLVLSNDHTTFNVLEYPRIRLDEVIFRSVEIIRQIHPTGKIEVNLQGELSYEDSLMIHANEPLILMAFNNLLKNGLQYSSDNKAKVIISASGKGRVIHFRNTGTSFTEDEKDRIFTPFYRASNSGNVRGFGLGLPLVKQILQLHQATITYNYIDGLNEFTIIFP